MTMFKLERATDAAGGDQPAILHLNDVPLEATAAFMAAATPAIVLARIAPQAGRLRFSTDGHKQQRFPRMLREVAYSIQNGWRAMDDALTDDERDDPEARRPRRWADELGGVLTTLADQVDGIYAEDSNGGHDE